MRVGGMFAVFFNWDQMPCGYVVKERVGGQTLPQVETSPGLEVLLFCTGRQKIGLEKVVRSIFHHGQTLEGIPDYVWAFLSVRLYDNKFRVSDFWAFFKAN